MGLSEVEFCRTQIHGNFASLTKQARSTSFLLISSVNILLRSKKRKKKPEMGDFYVSKLLFLRVQIFSLHLFALRYQIPFRRPRILGSTTRGLPFRILNLILLSGFIPRNFEFDFRGPPSPLGIS